MNKIAKFVLWASGLLVFFVVAARATVFEAWTIPTDLPWLSASIAPTLGPGDTVIMLTKGEPGFGDLVRCRDPDNQGYLVGRVVGLPGDQVKVSGLSLQVNNTSYNASDACRDQTTTVVHPDTDMDVDVHCARVEMGGGWHFRGNLKKRARYDDIDEKVGPDHLFLLSDNRDLHEDSRDFGTLERSLCDRRIVLRLWGPGGWSESDRRADFIR
ncbi:MAG: signal peptidase I [Myxococcota bacterium]